MIRNIFAGLLLCGPVMLYAQEPVKDSTVYLDTLRISVPAGPMPYQASATRVWDIVNTRIALSFDRKEKTADAREWLKLRPYFYATDTMELDAKGMRMDSVLLVSKKGNTPLRYTYEKDKLRITFDKTYAATDTVTLYLVFKAMPYASKTGGSAAITDDRGLYFINTDGQAPNKHAHIWTQGETEANSHWMVTIDKPNSRHTTQIELTVPDSLTTLSNGALVKQVVMKPTGMRTDIWKMDMPIQVYATMFAIGKYSVIKDKWKNKEVSYYVEPEYAPYARKMFQHTPEMMEYFSTRTGVAYPWNKYSQVVVRDYVSGAMENTTASLFGEFMNLTDRELMDKENEDIVSHELFHQWFGDYVTCESWSNTTVNESFANYGEQLWRNWKHGKVSGAELAWNDLQLYIAASRGNDPQLARFYYDSREEMFDAISYNKGGATLHYLNRLIGDAAFDKAMKLYLTQNALRSAEAHNWRLAVEEATGQDWNWFFNEWYYHAGHPVLKVEHNYDDAAQVLNVKVSQVQEDSVFMYRLPLKTAVMYGTEETIVDWDINKRTHTFSYPYRNGVRPVVIPDNAHVLPGEIKENKKPIHWAMQYGAAKDHISRRLALNAAGKAMSDSASQAIIDMGLNDSVYQLRKYALGQIERAQSDKYRKRWAARVTDIAANDDNRQVRAAAFDVLAAWKTNAAKTVMLRAVNDSSYMVAGAALEALDKLDKDTAYAIAKKLLATKPGGALESVIWTLIGKKGTDEDVALYEANAAGAYRKKMSFGMSLGAYMKNVSSNEAFGRAAKVYADITVWETSKMTRTMLGGSFFQTVGEYKGKLKDEDKDVAARAGTRMPLLKTAAGRIAKMEGDEEQKKKYEEKMKENFE
ncbi:M1 family metallopeptidase [Nemorincola caseinilytica]